MTHYVVKGNFKVTKVPNRYSGGAQTNASGLLFEQTTSLDVALDSPYIPASETTKFTNYTKDGFTYEDHVRLAELYKCLVAKEVKVMLSNR